MQSKFLIALCQMTVTEDRGANLKKAEGMIARAVDEGASLAVLPEMFNCPYDNSKFRDYAEEIRQSETVDVLANAAARYGIHIIGGSMPELHEGKVYNTSVIFGSTGELIGTHRKMHLFDIDVPGKITFKESEVLSAGNSVTVVDTPLCSIGVAICYDMRFPELMRQMALKGARLIVVPAAFNLVTGPAHWELIVRMRALDNQLYVAAASPARNTDASYIAYGHSMVSDPWGSVTAEAGHDEELLVTEIDLGLVERIRRELPLLKNRRDDIYPFARYPFAMP